MDGEEEEEEEEEEEGENDVLLSGVGKKVFGEWRRRTDYLFGREKGQKKGGSPS